MSWPSPHKTLAAAVDLNMLIDNSTGRGITIKYISLARLSANHKFTDELYSILKSCRTAVPSPSYRDMSRLLQTPDGMVFSYLARTAMTVDGSPSESGIVSLRAKDAKYIEVT